MTEFLFNGQKVNKISIITKPAKIWHLGKKEIITELALKLSIIYTDERGEKQIEEIRVKGYPKI